MKNSRREFIWRAGIAGLALGTAGNQKLTTGFISDGGSNNKLQFLNPVEGDMLNAYDGILTGTGLQIKAEISGPPGLKIRLNGIDAKYSKGIYSADIVLRDFKNNLEITDADSGERQSISVFWLKNYAQKYRLSLDDNIWFLKDIHINSSKYTSIFENPYLGFLRSVHETYGTKIHLNIYFQTDGFNLSEMTAKYKKEWTDNSGWLRLSFHALQNDPDKPYINSGYNEVKRDCDKVLKQIRRFAGDALTGPVTTLHWGEATIDGCRALRDSGYKVLAGYFNVDDPEPVSYYLAKDKVRHLKNRYIWYDRDTDIIFARMAIVINTFNLDQIVPHLDSMKSDTHLPAYADLMIHEQYFYPFYVNYQPDYRQKVITSVKWAADHGYQPSFLSEAIFG